MVTRTFSSLTTALSIFGICLVLIEIVDSLLVAVMWLRTAIVVPGLERSIFWNSVFRVDSARVSRSLMGSPLQFMVRWTILILLLAGLWWVTGLHFFLFFGLYAAILNTKRIASRACPPAALFLAASSKESVDALHEVKMNLHPCRIASLLNFDPLADRGMYNFLEGGGRAVYADSLRTSDNDDWRRIVHTLMRVVPCIIADLNEPSDYLREELTYASEIGLTGKIVHYAQTESAGIDSIRSMLGNNSEVQRIVGLPELLVEVQERVIYRYHVGVQGSLATTLEWIARILGILLYLSGIMIVLRLLQYLVLKLSGRGRPTR